MKIQTKPKYRLLYNNDGYCIFQQSSPYQNIAEPVGLAQVHGYVDEVASAGCDALLLSPVISSIPIWPSKVDPYWETNTASKQVSNETVIDKIYNRVKTFVNAGHDLVQLVSDRAKQKKLAFFISWRMNELHDIRRGDRSPALSRFWREHPEYWLSGPNAKTLWGRALDFSHAEVRDFKFALIRELCTQYPIDGLELDFLRFARFFPSTLPIDEQSRILREFITRVRQMLDEEVGNIPLCVRVQNRPDLVKQMGLDLPLLFKEGLIQMVNLAPFIVTQQDGEIEEFRKLLPDIALYGEITHCIQYGKLIETGVFEERRITREIILSSAFSFLDRGCDGVSTYNFTQTRDFSFGVRPERHREPDFEALSHVNDFQYLSRISQHYVLTDDRYSKQLPIRLNVEEEKIFQIYIPDDLGNKDVSSTIKGCLLRIRIEKNSSPIDFEALIGETPLKNTKFNGELFPVPLEDVVVEDSNQRGDFEVPIHMLQKGWNKFTVRLVTSPRVTIEGLELAIYR